MIDWTDRSEDVLARFGAWREWSPSMADGELMGEHEKQLMRDLATMVDGLSHGLASSNKSIPGMPYDGPLCNPGGCRRSMMMYATDPETGERLFPDPKE